jgi:hypothetical protein
MILYQPFAFYYAMNQRRAPTLVLVGQLKDSGCKGAVVARLPFVIKR